MTTAEPSSDATTVAPLTIADRTFRSRLILGTGKYTDSTTMVRSFEAAGTEMVTVALRRVDLNDPDQDAFIHHIDQDKYLFLPNTAGCYTAEDAVPAVRSTDSPHLGRSNSPTP